MRVPALLLGLGLATAAHPQLKKDQIACLSRLDQELPDGWTITDQQETSFLVAGKWVKAYAADLFTPLTAREDGNNEEVSLNFFPKALADSVEAVFHPLRSPPMSSSAPGPWWWSSPTSPPTESSTTSIPGRCSFI